MKETSMSSYQRKAIPQALRKAVWERFKTKNNMVICQGCRVELDSFEFQCGHKQSVAQGGPTILDNLVPICSTCNTSMGPRNLDEFLKQYLPSRHDEVDRLLKEQDAAAAVQKSREAELDRRIQTCVEEQERLEREKDQSIAAYRLWNEQHNQRIQAAIKQQELKEADARRRDTTERVPAPALASAAPTATTGFLLHFNDGDGDDITFMKNPDGSSMVRVNNDTYSFSVLRFETNSITLRYHANNGNTWDWHINLAGKSCHGSSVRSIFKTVHLHATLLPDSYFHSV